MSIDRRPVRRCALYARLSVSKEESVSIERQLTSCRKYAEARGWEIVGEYVDDGVSATANRPEDRKGWSALMSAPQFDAAVIWKIDRLARKVLDFLHVDEALQMRGAGLVAVEDPIDMTSPQGRAFAVMLAVFGEMEAEAIRSRIKAARATLIRNDRFVGGTIPYGYTSTDRPDGPGRTLIRDPHRFPWLERIVVKGVEGVPVNEIARWLTEQRAPLPARSTRTPGSEHTWYRQTVEQLLRNPTIAGARPHNPGRARSGKAADPMAVVRDDDGTPVIDAGLAVITWQQFEQLQTTLNQRDAPQARKFSARTRTSPFLSRVARCDACDVYLCRGTNQGKPVLSCPKCRQTLSRLRFEPWLIDRLLTERGEQPHQGHTVAAPLAGGRVQRGRQTRDPPQPARHPDHPPRSRRPRLRPRPRTPALAGTDLNRRKDRPVTCDVCGLPDPYRGDGDGIGSCDCPRCDHGCGVARSSYLCQGPDDDDPDDGWPDDVSRPGDQVLSQP